MALQIGVLLPLDADDVGLLSGLVFDELPSGVQAATLSRLSVMSYLTNIASVSSPVRIGPNMFVLEAALPESWKWSPR